jgi:hypothetical protein
MRTKGRDIPDYLIGDVVRKPGIKRKGYILDDHVPATDERLLLVYDKKGQRILERRFTPLELFVLGYEVVGHLKQERLQYLRLLWVTGRSRYTKTQRRQDHEEEHLRKHIGKKLQRKEGKDENETCQQQTKRQFRRTK